MVHRIVGLTDDQLKAYEQRAEDAMRVALQQVMDTIADRIGQVQTAAGMPPWDVLVAHLPGKHNQKDHGHGGGGGGKKKAPSGGSAGGRGNDGSGGGPSGGGGQSEALTGPAASKAVPSGYSRSQGLRPRPKGMSRTEVEDAETSLRIYQGASSQDIQAHLRGTSTGPGLGYGRQASDIQTTMDHSRLQQDIVVYRGVRHPETTFTAMGGRYSNGDMTGVTVTEKGFLSTSTRRKVATDFADQSGGGGVVMEIRMPAGTGAVRLQGVGESEVLGQSGLALTVMEDRGFVDGVRHLVVEAS